MIQKLKFIENSNVIDDIYKNVEDYNLIKKRKIMTAFDDMLTDMLNNIKLNPIVPELEEESSIVIKETRTKLAILKCTIKRIRKKKKVCALNYKIYSLY